MIDIELYQDLDQEQINESFINACETGYMELVFFLLEESPIKAEVDYDSNAALKNACIFGHLNIVELLLSYQEVSNIIDINDDIESPLYAAIQHNQLHIIKYFDKLYEVEKTTYERLLTFSSKYNYLDSTQYILSVDSSLDIKESIIIACQEGGVETVKYLTSFKPLEQYLIEQGFVDSCAFGRVAIADYFLENFSLSDEFKDEGFKKSCERRHEALYKNFLIEHNWLISEDLLEWLEGGNFEGIKYEHVLSTIRARDLSQKLNDSLEKKPIEYRLKKI